MKRWLPPVLVLLVLAGLAAGWRLRACGPFLVEPDFAVPNHPDPAPEAFRGGDLGILRAGFPESDRWVAWRLLRGLPVPAPEPRADPGLDAAVAAWTQARARWAPGPAAAPVDPYGQMPDDAFQSYYRINPSALVTAAATLAARAREHQEDPAALAEWVAGQDRVFASRPEACRPPEPVTGPDWLRRDRDYQRAAALFYGGRWAEARAAFAAVQGDPASPWQPWARYLQARCWVREAQLGPRPADPLVPYRRAQALLEDALAALPADHPARSAARDYLQLVRFRTDPLGLAREAARDAAAAHPHDFWGDLETLAGAVPRVRERKLDPVAAWGDPGTPERDALTWVEALDTSRPDRWRTCLDEYRRAGAREWLLAALVQCPDRAPEAPDLLAAVDRLPAGGADGPTLRWHALRLRLVRLAGAERRRALDQALGQDLPPWAGNALRAQRAALADSLGDWAGYLTRRPVRWFNAYEPLPAPLPAEALDAPGAWAVNRCLTLAQLRELAGSPRLPAALRGEMVRAAWTRAVLLERWDEARAALPALDPALARRARLALDRPDPLERRFELARLLLDYPALRPGVAAGVGQDRFGRALTESSFLRDNWWCAPGRPANLTLLDGAAEPAPGQPMPAFLDSGPGTPAARERDQLDRVPSAPVWFGEGVLAYAARHPRDPRLAETLHRVVQTTRYARCPGPDVSAVSRRCWTLLHRGWPASAWARKTPYYY